MSFFLFFFITPTDDLTNYAEEISDLFVQCFSTLSVQASIIASLLAMVFKSNRIFPTLVVEKLTARFTVALQKDEVQTAKLLLRSMASLASSNCVLLSGENSFFSILEALNDVTEGSWVSRKEGSSEKAVLDHQGQVTAYLVATAIPWVLTSFNEPRILTVAEIDGARVILNKLVLSCERVCTEWVSPFEVDGQQAVFHVGIIHSTDSAANTNADDMEGKYMR